MQERQTLAWLRSARVRCGTSRTGLPIGVQIAANPWREDVALALARVLEMDPDKNFGLIQV
jgi:Asp-tRNA(Asn)/Glu-tRNA(Gln) amidotransferase A subunit family amidase